MKTIEEYLKEESGKDEDLLLTSLQMEKKLYEKLKKKLKKDGYSMKDFYTANAKMYLNEESKG